MTAKTQYTYDLHNQQVLGISNRSKSDIVNLAVLPDKIYTHEFL